jgi:hypothetical protein
VQAVTDDRSRADVPANESGMGIISLSPDAMWFLKKILPAIWFALLTLYVGVSLAGFLVGGTAPVDLFLLLRFLIMPLAAGAFVFLVVKHVLWGMADEVRDGGEYLLVRRGREIARIELADIEDVSASTSSVQSRITLRLAHSSRFGSQVAFLPKRSARRTVLARHEVAEDLILRVERARRTERG